ncbi:ribonuclease H-like protein [Macrolepiota fuliginosa MF-IS2]|uniref:ribonuclease H n=1 Tax=Macrolepiota fuliginosa MF-IS2 TaxID=1400762 RepID=A0A9P5X663_9AGAR|nr:ribonuclease H-like protein [Macrolepiota fuliginosa MF-IS2]
MAIFIDGACARNGTPDAQAGIGVYICCGSAHNLSKPLQNGPHTNQRAEIQAAIAAVKYVRRIHRDGDFRPSRGLVLTTDSGYLVKAMTEYINKWERNGWKNNVGKPVVNAEDFKELEGHISFLEGQHIRVRFWLVDRKYNTEADELAKEAVELSA